MRYAVGLAVAGLALLSAYLYLVPDLRGWTPADPRDPAARVEPTRAGTAAFAIGDCFPGTVDPWNVPAARDGQGFDSQSMLTCRSRRSVWVAIGLYLGVVLAGLALLRRCARFRGR